LQQAAEVADHNMRKGNLDAEIYVTLQSTHLAKQDDATRLRASLERAQSALAILLGLPFQTPNVILVKLNIRLRTSRKRFRSRSLRNGGRSSPNA
jgi:hypothetical protein